MPTIESTVAQMPLFVSSRPTAGPTISVPSRLKPPRLLALSAASIFSAVVLSEAPASAPTSGTRIIICRWDGSPDTLMTRSWPNVGSSAARTC